MSFCKERRTLPVILNGTQWSEESKRVCETVRVVLCPCGNGGIDSSLRSE